MKQEDFFKSKVDLEDMVSVQEKFNEAGHTDVPIAVMQGDKLKVVGDANKTEVKSRDYTMRFRFPKSMAANVDEKDILVDLGEYVIVRFEFTDVHIVPRRDYEIMESIIDIIPFFKGLADDGITLTDLSQPELLKVLHNANEQIGDAMYNVVAAFLDINPEIKRYMILTDVMARVQDFENDFPEVFKNADVFFG